MNHFWLIINMLLFKYLPTIFLLIFGTEALFGFLIPAAIFGGLMSHSSHSSEDSSDSTTTYHHTTKETQTTTSTIPTVTPTQAPSSKDDAHSQKAGKKLEVIVLIVLGHVLASAISGFCLKYLMTSFETRKLNVTRDAAVRNYSKAKIWFKTYICWQALLIMIVSIPIWFIVLSFYILVIISYLVEKVERRQSKKKRADDIELGIVRNVHFEKVTRSNIDNYIPQYHSQESKNFNFLLFERSFCRTILYSEYREMKARRVSQEVETDEQNDLTGEQSKSKLQSDSDSSGATIDGQPETDTRISADMIVIDDINTGIYESSTIDRDDQSTNDERFCVICLDEYDDQDRITILPCGHYFHCQCLIEATKAQSRYNNAGLIFLYPLNLRCPLCQLHVLRFYLFYREHKLNPNEVKFANTR